jgi:hypothetical protein
MQGEAIRIGDLRYQVTVATRGHSTDPNDLNITDLETNLTKKQVVYANIIPVGTQSYLLGQQLVIGSVTHRITIRWRPTLTNQDVVLHKTIQPNGITRVDTYKIHRMGSWEGRQRFLILDCELETNV